MFVNNNFVMRICKIIFTNVSHGKYTEQVDCKRYKLFSFEFTYIKMNCNKSV